MWNRGTAEGTRPRLATGRLADCADAAPLQTGFPSPPTVRPAGTGLAGPSEHSHSAPPPFLVRRSLVRVGPGSYPAVTPSGHAPSCLSAPLGRAVLAGLPSALLAL